MAGAAPAIHASRVKHFKSWMPGARPGMTSVRFAVGFDLIAGVD
jgi:hypothetical protein